MKAISKAAAIRGFFQAGRTWRIKMEGGREQGCKIIKASSRFLSLETDSGKRTRIPLEGYTFGLLSDVLMMRFADATFPEYNVTIYFRAPLEDAQKKNPLDI